MVKYEFLQISGIFFYKVIHAYKATTKKLFLKFYGVVEVTI